MIKCPFCHFENEDGALFCERCTSDLTAVAPTVSAAKGPPPPPHAIPVAEAIPYIAEAVPYEAVPAEPLDPISAVPFEAVPVAAAEPYAAIPLALEAIEPATPVVAEAVPAAEPHRPPEVPAVPPPVPASTGPQAPSAAPPESAPAAGPAGFLPPHAQPRLLVLRGQKRNVEYPIFDGQNFIGRADEKPVDIDLEEQEPPDRVWCSRQHACIHWEDNQLAIEDLNSANGTYVNRTRVYPGQKRSLSVNDIVQIGNVQLKVVV